MSSKKQNIKWRGLVSFGEAIAVQKKNSPWVRSSEGRDYLIRPGFKSERSITLANGDVCQVFCEVIKPGFVPLFKCTCEEKSVEIIATTPTQAANNVLKALGFQTNKHWSGPIFFGFLRQEIFSKLSVNRVSDNNENEIFNTNECEASSCDTDNVTINIAQRSGRLVNWLGILSVGEDPPCDDGISSTLWSYGSGDNVVPLRPGYDARLAINSEGKSFEISCKIVSSLSSNFGPIFQCEVISGGENLYPTQEVKPTTAVRNVFNFLKIKDYRKKISGYEFFGFQRKDVIRQLQAKVSRKRQLSTDEDLFTTLDDTRVVKKKFVSQYPLLDKIANTKTRNAGPTKSLKPQGRKERNTLIHEMVKFTSSNDVQSYIVYLCQNDPSLVTSAIEDCGSYLDEFVSKLEITGPRHLSLHNSAEFLIGKTRLSQREYIAASKTLKKANVYLSPYAAVAKYVSELDVGVINLHKHCVDFEYEGLDCICSSAEFKDTLERVISTKELFQKFEFPTQEQQTNLFAYLKKEDPKLYEKVDPCKRTLFLRETGDNFRGSANQPTEQMSFNILNLTKLINSPYGQFLISIWRGPETRNYIEAHVKGHYADVMSAVRNGLTLKLADDTMETFNIITILVTDLGHLKESLGKCLCTSIFGCYWCKKNMQDWDNKKPTTSPLQKISDMVKMGQEAECVLGKCPDKSSAAYTKFQQSHFGQTVSIVYINRV